MRYILVVVLTLWAEDIEAPIPSIYPTRSTCEVVAQVYRDWGKAGPGRAATVACVEVVANGRDA